MTNPGSGNIFQGANNHESPGGNSSANGCGQGKAGRTLLLKWQRASDGNGETGQGRQGRLRSGSEWKWQVAGARWQEGRTRPAEKEGANPEQKRKRQKRGRGWTKWGWEC
ncbi:hypothetical protein FOFC_09213 [Fusarium oxysporum]|nr:hypothetical protein FOFC_09213 [Fusarium oxysporum]